MKNRLIWVLAIIFVLCGGGWFLMQKQAQATAAKEVKPDDYATVKRTDQIVTVVNSGTLDAVRSVEVKSRVTGRLKNLFVEEGDIVKQGQLIAIIDPKEARLKLIQDEAQLHGAEHGAQRTQLEINQKRQLNQASLAQARAKLRQLELEVAAQPKLTEAAILEAQSSLNSAKQERLRQIESLQPNQRVQARNNVLEAQVNYDTAKKDYDRQVDLEQKGYVSGRVVESSKQTLDLAKVRLDQARDNEQRLDGQLNAELAKLDASIKQGEAAVARALANRSQDEIKLQEKKSAIADVQRAIASLQDASIQEKSRLQNIDTVEQLRSVRDDSKRQLDETEIRAPIDGIVTKKSLQIGELATGLSSFSSGSTIVKIEDRSHMRVLLDVNEIDVARMTLGMSANVEVDAIPNKKFTGVVKKMAPASKDSANTVGGASGQSADSVVKYQVEIALNENDPKLRTGMSTKCYLIVGERKNTLVLPIEFIVKEEGRAYVELPSEKPKPDPKETPVRKEVKLGLSSGSQVEILSGLQEGDRVHRPKFGGPARRGMISAEAEG